MTLNDEQTVIASLVDSPFIQQRPFTIEMHEHLNRQKEVSLLFSLSEESLRNTV